MYGDFTELKATSWDSNFNKMGEEKVCGFKDLETKSS